MVTGTSKQQLLEATIGWVLSLHNSSMARLLPDLSEIVTIVARRTLRPDSKTPTFMA